MPWYFPSIKAAVQAHWKFIFARFNFGTRSTVLFQHDERFQAVDKTRLLQLLRKICLFQLLNKVILFQLFDRNHPISVTEQNQSISVIDQITVIQLVDNYQPN